MPHESIPPLMHLHFAIRLDWIGLKCTSEIGPYPSYFQRIKKMTDRSEILRVVVLAVVTRHYFPRSVAFVFGS